MTDFPYQIGLMGNYKPHLTTIYNTIKKRFLELGFTTTDFTVLEQNDIRSREKRSPFAAIYFGKENFPVADDVLLKEILDDSAIILPIVESLVNFSKQVPNSIVGINGIALDPADKYFDRDVATVLEGFRLLRAERRLFISYKREDSRAIAAQLYEEFDRRGFDVFLDTHGVPPGRDFQSTLWHRLADSDVVVLLDTPHFFESRWTTEEMARANSTNIQILHLLWPGRPSVAASALSTFFPMSSNMFEGAEVGDSARLAMGVLGKIAIKVEEIRARALSQRHRYLLDAFCDQAKKIGLSADVQPTRNIILRTPRKTVSVVPLIGVPSSPRLHEIHDANSTSIDECWALYDERGLLENALGHLEWLNSSLPIKTLPVLNVVKQLDIEAKA